MAKKKKKKIVARVGLDGTISDYNSTPKSKKVVAKVSLDGDIAPIKQTTTTKKKDEGVFSAFNDGYDFGDISKTVLKGGKQLITTAGSKAKKIGTGLVTDPIQTIKSTGVSIAEGIDNTVNAIDNTADDFFDWLLKREDDGKIDLNIKEQTRLSYASDEEKKNVLKQYAKDYGTDSEEYKQIREFINLDVSKDPTAIENILNPKYYLTDTYKAHQEGTLSEEQEEIYGIGQQIGAMLPSVGVGMINPALGRATFFVQAQQNYTEEARSQGHTDTQARIYGLTMGGFETLVEALGFDEMGGLKSLSKGNILRNMAGEGLEEFIMPYIDKGIKTIGFGEKYDLEGATEEAIEGAVMGAITGGIMNASGKGLRAVDNFVNKVNSGQQITQEDIVNAGVELQEADPNTFEEVMASVPEVVQQEIQKTQEQNQVLKQQNYQYIPKETDSIQRKTISEDASKYANNTPRTQEFIDLTVNVSEASGVNFRLANNEAELIVNEKNKLIEKYAKNNNVTIEEATERFKNTTIDAYNNGEIVINIDSPKALNRLVGHEVTHSLEGTKEYSNLQRIATEYAKTKGEYDTRISDLQALYEGTNANIDNELTSDLIGDYLFTDQEFINNIHTQDKNLFQRIYDEIKHLYKMATAGSKEARQLEQLKHSFEKAMRENKQNATDINVVTKHSVSKVSKQYLEKQFKELTGDSIQRAEAVLGGIELRNNMREAGNRTDAMESIPYSDEAMEIYKTYKNSKKSSNALYHTTAKENLQSILAKGLTTDNKARQEGVSGEGKLYLASNEKLASSFGTDTDIILRVNPKYNLDNIESDLLGGEGTYSTTDNIPVSALQVKENGKWVKLEKSQLANPTSDPDIRYSLSEDSEGKQLSEKQIEYFKNSKVVDREGNLKVLYHGTPTEFNVFNYKYLGKNGTDYGKGFYLTDKLETAKSYASRTETGNGGKVMKVYANITNPLAYGGSTIRTDQFQDFVEAINEASNGQLFADMSGEYVEKGTKEYNDTLNDFMMDFEYGGDDIDVVENILSANPISREEGYRILKETTGKDGIIVETSNEDNALGNLYIPFLSSQIKNVDNINPTDDVDIRRSLSNQEQDIAPTSGDIFGSEIKLQQQVQEAIAPLQETIQELNDKITTLQENIAPVSQQEVEEQGKNSFQAITDKDAPTPLENTTPDVAPTSDIIVDPFEERDIKAVGNRKVNAYMYENPEVKPFFQQSAREMLGDLQNSIKGEKVWLQELNPTTGQYEESMVTGTQRLTTDDIAELLDTYHYTYAQIEKGLNAIIEDNGKENNAVSKRIEFMLNDRLLKGYKSVDGFPIPPNEEYRALIRNKNIQEYTDQAYQEWNKSINQDNLAPTNIDNVSNTNIEAQNVPLENDLAPTKVNAPKTQKQTLNEPRIENVMLADPMESLTRQAGRQVAETMKYTKGKPRITKTKKQMFGDAWSKFREQFFNSFHSVDKFAKDTGNQQIKFNTDMYNNVYAEIDGELTTAQTDSYGNPIGEALLKPFEEAKASGEYEQLNDYLMHYSNIDRHLQGKGSVVPLEYSRKMVAEYDKANPNLNKYARRVWRGYKNDLANMQANGLISGQFNMTLQSMYPHYSPFMFVQDFVPSMESDGVARPKKVVKSAEGGAFEILEMEEARVRYTQSVRSAIRKNDVLKEIVKTSKDKISIGADTRIDPTDINQGMGIDEKGNYFATAFVNGQMQQAVISEDMYRELMQEGKQSMRAIEDRYAVVTKPLQWLSKWKRNLVTTLSPTFVVTNPIKDVQDASFNSKYTKDFMKYYPTAVFELGQAKTDLAKQFLTLYGSGNSYGEYTETTTKNQKNSKFVKNVVNAVPNFNNLVELAPRFAEFKASLDNGCNIQEAMYNAREVTINFGRGGYIAKALNRNGFTFLNASLQGFDKLARNFSGENGAKGVVGALSKVAILGVAPALFNALAFGVGDDEDEDYKALPDYIKDNYYLIKTSDGKFIRIPKGRMLSIFGSAGRRTLEYMQGEKDAFEGYLTNAYSQVGVQNPLESNVFAPFLQAFGSKEGKTWYGTDLVPTRLQDVPAEEQYDESTDEFSKWLGQQLGISPYKINYVLDQYTGGIGDIVLPMITEEATSDGNLLAPIKDKFTANTTFDNKYVSGFYGTKDEMEIRANSSKATEEDILKSKYLSSVSWEMSELYKEKREVQSNSDLSKAEKYERVQKIQEQINSLAEEGLNNYENINKTSSYAIVGDREFYKDADKEWRSPYDDELEELNSLGMDLDDKSSYFEAKNGIYLINEKYRGTEDTYQDRKQEIIEVVRNSTLNTDYKSYLYGKYYAEDTTNIVNMLGINFDAYLDYESQYFVADKDEAGKTISGSKKKKVFDYINSMNIGFEEKLILAKLKYNTYDEYNHEIINYLNNSNVTYDEMVFILKQMGFTVTNDGNIYWD